MINLWFTYVWPSLKGNGPEDLLATILVAVIASVLWPPTRRRIEAFAARHVKSIKQHVTDEHQAVRDRLDHIIEHHPDIPDFVPKEHHDHH